MSRVERQRGNHNSKTKDVDKNGEKNRAVLDAFGAHARKAMKRAPHRIASRRFAIFATSFNQTSHCP
jgi:hypothetical protein